MEVFSREKSDRILNFSTPRCSWRPILKSVVRIEGPLRDMDPIVDFQDDRQTRMINATPERDVPLGSNLLDGEVHEVSPTPRRDAFDAYPNPYRAARENAGIGSDGRFSSHNLVVGSGLGIWGFVMATGMAGSADQRLFDSHPSLLSAVDVMQLITFLNGLALFVSGLALEQKQSWGYRLAMGCAAVSILGGIAFLAVWRIILQSSGDDLAEAAGALTFVRTNLDLLIGLVDGGALLVFLVRNRLRRTRGAASGNGSR
jgi:hypothetical protein